MLDLTAVNVETLNSLQLQTYIVSLKSVLAFREEEGLTELEPQHENTLSARLSDAEARLGKLTSDALAAAEARAKGKIDSLKTTAEKRAEAEADLAKINKLRKKLRG